MDKTPDLDDELIKDIETSIDNLDTDMGLDLEFNGDFAIDYYSSINAIRKLECTYGQKSSKLSSKNPEPQDD